MRAVKGEHASRCCSVHDAFVVGRPSVRRGGPSRDVGSLMCMEEEASYMYRSFQIMDELLTIISD